MATSYNGWSVIKSGLWPLPAVTGSVRAGAVWVVFHWLAKEYAARVEKITRAHSWGRGYVTAGSMSIVWTHCPSRTP